MRALVSIQGPLDDALPRLSSLTQRSCDRALLLPGARAALPPRGEGARRALREVRVDDLRRAAEVGLQEHPPRAQAAGDQRVAREEGVAAVGGHPRGQPRPESARHRPKKLDDVLDAKNSAIKDLQYELARVTKAHNDVIRVYESKLTEFGIPVEELGFRPLVTSTGTGPAGLVVS